MFGMFNDKDWALYDYFTSHYHIKPKNLEFDSYDVLLEIRNSIDPFEWLCDDCESSYYMEQAYNELSYPYHFEDHIKEAQWIQLQESLDHIYDALFEYYKEQEESEG